MVYSIQRKSDDTEVERFGAMSERAYRGLLMKVDSTRFKVQIYDSAATADFDLARMAETRAKATEAAKALIKKARS